MRINFRYFIFSHGLCRSTYLNIRWIIGSGTQKYHSRYLEHIFNLRHIWFPRVAATMEWEWYPCIKSIWDSMLSKRIPKMCKASNWCVCDIWHEPNSMHFFRLMFIYHILMVVVVCVCTLYNTYCRQAYAHIWWPNVFYSIRNFLFVMHTKTLKQYKIASTFLKFNLILWTFSFCVSCIHFWAKNIHFVWSICCVHCTHI